MNKKTIINILKSLVTITLFTIVIYKIDFTEFKKTIQNIKYIYLVLLFTITILQSIFSVKGWQIALLAYNISFKYFKLLFYYYIGAFYSLTLPGTIGGDVVKVYLVGDDGKKYKESISSLIIQRSIGLLVFISFLVIPATLFSDIIYDNKAKILLTILLLVLLLICILIYYSIALQTFIVKLMKRISSGKLISLAISLLDSILFFRNKKKALFKLIIVAILVYISSLLLRYIVYKSLDLNMDLFHFFSIVIFVSLMVQIPISFAGIGIREGSYVFFFAQAGISPEIALTFALLEFLPGLIINLCAGALYFISGIKDSIVRITSKELENR